VAWVSEKRLRPLSNNGIRYAITREGCFGLLYLSRAHRNLPMKQEPRPQSPISEAVAKLVDERAAQMARLLWCPRFAEIAKALAKEKLCAELDRIDGDGLSLLVLTAALRPEPKEAPAIADALLNTRAAFQADDGHLVETTPAAWPQFRSGVEVMSAVLFPTTPVERVGVGIDRADAGFRASIGFTVGTMRTIWTAPISDTAFIESGLVDSHAALIGAALAEIATLFRLKGTPESTPWLN
jgi:hypothetical protein